MAKQPEWAILVPRRWRLPAGGYEVEFRIVSDSYLKRHTGQVWGCFMDYGTNDIRGKKLPPKVGVIYLNASQDRAQFLNTFQHEIHHALVDWSGLFFNAHRE